MLWADKQWNWIWIWYSGCLHNSPTQVSSRTCKLKTVQRQTFADLFQIMYSKLYGLWGRRCSCEDISLFEERSWESLLWPVGLILVLCCNAPEPPCSSDSIAKALPVHAHYNINPGPFGRVTLNTFSLIVTH